MELLTHPFAKIVFDTRSTAALHAIFCTSFQAMLEDDNVAEYIDQSKFSLISFEDECNNKYYKYMLEVDTTYEERKKFGCYIGATKHINVFDKFGHRYQDYQGYQGLNEHYCFGYENRANLKLIISAYNEFIDFINKLYIDEITSGIYLYVEEHQK